MKLSTFVLALLALLVAVFAALTASPETGRAAAIVALFAAVGLGVYDFRSQRKPVRSKR